MLRLSSVLLMIVSPALMATEAVDVYTQEQLLSLIRSEQHLVRVKQDDCQLVQDIEAHAEVLKQPLYQFLWGEMFIHGVCIKKDVPRGLQLLKDAAGQGSTEAMLQVARYYEDGKYVLKNKHRSVQYLYPAAANGDQKARMMLVRLYNEGFGSPRDYEMAYHWLYNEAFNDQKTKDHAWRLLQKLESMMPASAVARARGEHLWNY
ncbi:tetratricopeptide repeat protein [Shewanella litorisediminis]|uniref:Sel1 repeat family protein n=1 Tax=Shewanella litorisediminis TaxID=1173586 RepID=A0ABX7G1S4_9GAMM|nr:tetratricopeptide repeat protein [Shewanella litorisediminis]MCL2918459.1 sel1 repeat family protein [Shewanella litorisediminis]QRH01292.1 sel1 repeat family protein [Shewanella litorisediminis]